MNQISIIVHLVTENIPAHNFVTVAGDFNTKLGPEDVKFTSPSTSSTDKAPPKTNRNGEKLLDYAEKFDLTISNTSFMKPPKKLWTFEAPNNNQYQLDYILVHKKWSNSIRD